MYTPKIKRESGQTEAHPEQDGTQTPLRKVPLKSYKELIAELKSALTNKAYFVELDVEAALDWKESGRPLVVMVDASDLGEVYTCVAYLVETYPGPRAFSRQTLTQGTSRRYPLQIPQIPYSQSTRISKKCGHRIIFPHNIEVAQQQDKKNIVRHLS